MIWLLANIKTVGIAALAVFLFAGGVYAGVRHEQPKIEKAAQEATEAERQVCLKSQSITKESDDALQAALSSLTAKYNRMLKLSKNGGNTANSASGNDGAASDNGFSIELRYIASKQALQLVSCQDFIRAERH